MPVAPSQKTETLQSVWSRLLAAHRRRDPQFNVIDQEILLTPVRVKKRLRFPLPVSFTRVVFRGNLDIRGSSFEGGATFIDVIFEDASDFSHCIFEGQAYFWNCRFRTEASFESVRVTDKPIVDSQRFPGETNFSYCEFDNSAQFQRFDAKGPTWFHRTIFKRNANFEGAHFAKRFIIDGTSNDICVAIRDFRSDVLPLLVTSGILINCRDHIGYYNFDRSIVSKDQLTKRIEQTRAAVTISQPLKLVDSLSNNQIGTHSTLEEIGVDLVGVPDLWQKKFLSATLPTGADCSFRGVVFDEESEFRHLHMDRCLLEGASVSNIDFVGVQWIRKIFRTWIGSRQITYDEFKYWERAQPAMQEQSRIFQRRLKDFLKNPKRWKLALMQRQQMIKASVDKRLKGDLRLMIVDRSKAPILDAQAERRLAAIANAGALDNNLSDLYHRLRMRHEQKGDRESARDFYYAELEMLRVNRSLASRSLSLANIYRLSSGYGKLEGLALTWLLLFIFLLFPIMFLIAGEGLDPTYKQLHLFGITTRSELASLEASTFLSRSVMDRLSTNAMSGPEQKADRYKRMIEGFERIVVPLQAGLFLLAVKTRFKGPG